MEVGNTLRHDLTKGITICNNKQPLNVGAIISKCQSNYSLAWLIVHKVIKERAGPISHIRQSATQPTSLLGGSSWSSAAHFAARRAFEKRKCDHAAKLEDITLLFKFFFPLFFFHPSPRRVTEMSYERAVF